LAFLPLAVLVLLTPARWRAGAACALATVALLAWVYSSFLFRDSLAMDGRDTLLNLGSPLGRYEWPLLAVAIVVVALVLSKIPRPAFMLLLALLVGNLALSVTHLRTIPTASTKVIERSPEVFSRFGRSDNVLAILLDGLQSDVAADELAKDASLSTAFDGFTFFRNTTGVAPSTYPTMPAVHSGHIWDPNQSLLDQYERNIVKGSFLSGLARSGYETALVPPIRLACPEGIAMCAGPPRGTSDVCPEGSSLCRTVAYVAGQHARVLPQILLLFDLSLVRVAPFDAKDDIHNGGNWLLSRGTQAAFSSAFMARALEPLELLAKTLTIDDGPPTAKFLHIFSTHAPYKFDSECTIQTAVVTGGMENAARCSLRKVASVLQRLKSENIYDSSTVLIFADHGAGRPSTYRSLGDGAVTFSPSTAAFANPALLIKPPAARGSLTHTMHPASIADIAATVCALTKRCTAGAGQSVFAPAPATRARKFYWYEWRTEYWALKSVPNVRSFVVTGPPWEAASWAIEGSAKLYTLGDAIRFANTGNGAGYRGPGWAESEAWGTWSDGGPSTARLSTVWDRKADLMLAVRARGFVAPQLPRQYAEVLVNGQRVGTLSFDTFDIVEQKLRLPAAVIGNSENIEIAFLVRTARSPAELGLSDDQRRLGIGVESMTLTLAPVEAARTAPAPAYSLSEEIDFRSGGNATQYLAAGWANSEPWGTWAEAEQATLRLTPTLSGKTDLMLSVQARAFVVPQYPRQDIDVLVNGRQAGTFSFDSFDLVERSLRVPADLMAGSEVLEMTFISKSARSPAELGLSADSRRLGIGIANVTLRLP